MTESTVADMTRYAALEKPLDFERAMAEVMAAKVEYALEQKRQEFAAAIFADPEEEDEAEESSEAEVTEEEPAVEEEEEVG